MVVKSGTDTWIVTALPLHCCRGGRGNWDEETVEHLLNVVVVLLLDAWRWLSQFREVK